MRRFCGFNVYFHHILWKQNGRQHIFYILWLEDATKHIFAHSPVVWCRIMLALTCVIHWYICYAPIHNLWPATKPVDRLRSGSAYPVSKPVRFKLAYCVDRVGVQARVTCSHGDQYDAALTETLTLSYSENWRVTTCDEKLCFHLSVHSKLELDCTDWGQLRWRIANYLVFILCWQWRCSMHRQLRLAPSIPWMC